MAAANVQKTNIQHAVPQNVLDVEFKIIGDLTMRQFFYIMVNGVFAYICFLAIQNPVIKWVGIISFFMFGAALAFMPLQERGLDEWIVNFFKAVYKSNQYVWKKDPILPSAFTYENIHVVKQEMITLAPTTSRRKLEKYLESYGATKTVDPLDMNIDKYVQKVNQAYAPIPSEVVTGPPQNTNAVPNKSNPNPQISGRPVEQPQQQANDAQQGVKEINLNQSNPAPGGSTGVPPTNNTNGGIQ